MVSTLEYAPVRETQEQAEDPLLALRHEQIRDQYRAYFDETLNGIRVAGQEETEQLQAWVENTQATEEDVHALQEFWELQIRKQLRSGRELRAKFDDAMNDAVKKGITSKKWTEKWTEKFENKSFTYKQREYWVDHQLPEYIRDWQKVIDERNEMVKHPDLPRIININPEFALLTKANEQAFLELPLSKQKDLIAEAQSTIVAEKKSLQALHAQTKTMLMGHVKNGVLSRDKVGGWLRRIFTPQCTAKSVENILTQKGKGTLDECIENWTLIRMQFDACVTKFEKLGEKQKPRGLRIVSAEKFLAMHYDERMVYVRNLETRLADAEEVRSEHEDIIHIRHLMDTGEWTEALERIEKVKTDPSLSTKDQERLKNMEQYSRMLSEKQKKKEEKESSVAEAIGTIDECIEALERECPEEVEKVEDLLESHHPNRGIANFYWIVYNHLWCREHCYLTDEVAKKGAQKETIEETRLRAEQGEDIGMHNAISTLTAEEHFFRKAEFAEKGATYQHIDVSKKKAQKSHTDWLLKEHTFYEMYWTNYCASREEEPKGSFWHENLANILRSLRSATRTLEKSGGAYKRKWKRKQ